MLWRELDDGKAEIRSCGRAGEAKGSNWRKWRGLVEVIQAAVLQSK